MRYNIFNSRNYCATYYLPPSENRVQKHLYRIVWEHYSARADILGFFEPVPHHAGTTPSATQP